MAEIIGESGAWGEIRKGLLKFGLTVGAPAEIVPLLARLKNELQPAIDRRTAEAAAAAASAQPLKSRAVLIPTEPPPLSPEERDRKYMPPAMREELEARERTFANAHPVCPHCNKPLVLRVYGKGPDAGKRFWGCHNYPVCRHTAPFE